jgi:hypothetical protein
MEKDDGVILTGQPKNSEKSLSQYAIPINYTITVLKRKKINLNISHG